MSVYDAWHYIYFFQYGHEDYELGKVAYLQVAYKGLTYKGWGKGVNKGGPTLFTSMVRVIVGYEGN